jgi:WD40 repeat protein
VTAGADALVLDATTGAEALTVPEQTDYATLRNPKWIGSLYSASFDPTGSRVVTGGVVRVWNADTGAELLTLRRRDFKSAYAASWSPDGTRLVMGFRDGTAEVWEVPSARPEGFARTEDKPPPRKGPNRKNESRLVRLEEGPLAFKGHTGPVTSAGFNRDGSRVVTTSTDGTVRVWEVKTGAEQLVLKGQVAAFGPDEDRVVIGTQDGIVKVHDAGSGAEVLRFRRALGSPRVFSVAWARDGSRVATGAEDGTVQVWDARTGDELLVLRGYVGIVFSVAWSPEGKRLVTACGDGTVRVWDTEFGAELLAFKAHTGGVCSVSWSPEGTRLVTVGERDEQVRIWNSIPLDRALRPKDVAPAPRAVE